MLLCIFHDFIYKLNLDQCFIVKNVVFAKCIENNKHNVTCIGMSGSLQFIGMSGSLQFIGMSGSLQFIGMSGSLQFIRMSGSLQFI
jgi:hypothetical protein